MTRQDALEKLAMAGILTTVSSSTVKYRLSRDEITAMLRVVAATLPDAVPESARDQFGITGPRMEPEVFDAMIANAVRTVIATAEVRT